MLHLKEFRKPIRVPTYKWLMTDLYDWLDSRNRAILERLEKAGRVRVDNGGWIHVIG